MYSYVTMRQVRTELTLSGAHTCMHVTRTLMYILVHTHTHTHTHIHTHTALLQRRDSSLRTSFSSSPPSSLQPMSMAWGSTLPTASDSTPPSTPSHCSPETWPLTLMYVH